jgi:hypothetical protein
MASRRFRKASLSHIFQGCFVTPHSHNDFRFALEGDFSRFYCEAAHARRDLKMKRAVKKMNTHRSASSGRSA